MVATTDRSANANTAKLTALKGSDEEAGTVVLKVLSLPTLIERRTGKVDTSGRYLYYLGAKETILDVVLRLVPYDAVRLVEPFTGSGALASGLAFRFNKIEASDLNEELIEAHKLAIENTEDFLADLRRLFSATDSNQQSFYDVARVAFNASKNPREKAVLLVFMNRKGFKGLMRRNRKGQFNVPFWKKRADEEIPELQIREFAQRLAGKTCFSTRDFRKSLEGAGKGDFCYLDPPYLAEEGKDGTFSEYVGAFGVKDHEEMAALCREAANKGATVVVSNHDSELVRRTYASADAICALRVPRSMSDTKGQGDSSAKEILAVWLPPTNWFEAFVRKPSLGEKPDMFHDLADPAALDRMVFKLAETNGWLESGAKADKISFRSFKENGRCLLSIARHGSPILRRLALEKPGREKLLSLHLLESLIFTESNYPPPQLLSEIEAARRLHEIATGLENVLGDHPLRDKAMSRLLKSKAEIYCTRLAEDASLPVKRLPDRYLAALNAVAAHAWAFDSEPCQRLLLYAELCQDRGSNSFINICEALEAGTLTLKSLLDGMPPLKVAAGKGLGIEEHKIIKEGAMRKIASALGCLPPSKSRRRRDIPSGSVEKSDCRN